MTHSTMNGHAHCASRRRFLAGVGMGVVALETAKLFEPGVFAEELQRRVRTPRTTEGPFYPDRLPLDTDNDLLIINDSITPAVGDVTHLGGTILDARGEPIRNALIEIWQVDHHGSYIHSRGANRQTNDRDKNFQGYGRFVTSSSGEYDFRTIKPVRYPGRTPHIHVRVSVKNREQVTSQIFIKGEPHNTNDMVLQGIRDLAARQSVIVDFAPLKDSTVNELAAKFDIVLGYTPEA